MKGMLFKSDLIPAIVEGRKTQTRRVIKPQPDLGLPEFERYSHIAVDWYHPTRIDRNGEKYPGDRIFGAYTDDGEWGWRCPYLVGETLYIKEAHYRYGFWRKNGLTKTGKQRWEFKPLPELAIPSLKGFRLRYYDNPPDEVQPNSYRKPAWYRRSPLFMPEWAARYFLKILAVRAERLQEIKIKDIWAEGLGDAIPQKYCCWALGPVEGLKKFDEFADLWNSINPKYPFDSNPWVWVYGFEFAGTQPREAT